VNGATIDAAPPVVEHRYVLEFGDGLQALLWTALLLYWGARCIKAINE
jgi:hypothetical protein